MDLQVSKSAKIGGFTGKQKCAQIGGFTGGAPVILCGDAGSCVDHQRNHIRPPQCADRALHAHRLRAVDAASHFRAPADSCRVHERDRRAVWQENL